MYINLTYMIQSFSTKPIVTLLTIFLMHYMYVVINFCSLTKHTMCAQDKRFKLPLQTYFCTYHTHIRMATPTTMTQLLPLHWVPVQPVILTLSILLKKLTYMVRGTCLTTKKTSLRNCSCSPSIVIHVAHNPKRNFPDALLLHLPNLYCMPLLCVGTFLGACEYGPSCIQGTPNPAIWSSSMLLTCPFLLCVVSHRIK